MTSKKTAAQSIVPDCAIIGGDIRRQGLPVKPGPGCFASGANLAVLQTRSIVESVGEANSHVAHQSIPKETCGVDSMN